MNALIQRVQAARRGAGAGAILFVSLAVLGGCSDILDVELPAQLGDEALEDPAGAQSQINTIIGQFENAHNQFIIQSWGREDLGEPLTAGSYDHPSFQLEPISPNDEFGPMMKSRRFAFLLHDKLVEDWTVEDVPQRAQFLAISSLYAGATLSWMGSSLCESAIDGGPLMTSAQTLAEADRWLTQAVAEVASAGGDFALPHGVASSARAMAYGLRAQARWMAGDLQGARLDAEQVPPGHIAYITRDTDAGRRNRLWLLATVNIRMYDVMDWWQGPPNPATGQLFPDVIPFTGWVNLAILPDGRAVREDGLPIRKEGPYTTAEEQADAYRDPRVQTRLIVARAGSVPMVNIPNRYPNADDDIPLVNWKEMVLIRAESELGQGAIDLVNEMRAFDNAQNGWDLPMVTYADPSNEQQIFDMIWEERRRALFSEGRFMYTKIRHPEVFWFPRNVGVLVGYGSPYYGGVRWLMPNDEYELNENFTLEDRATGCAVHQAPVQY